MIGSRPCSKRLGDHLHDVLFAGAAWFGERAQERFLRLLFRYKFRRADPWALTTSPYEKGRYDDMLAQAPESEVLRILDIGCAEGVYTRRLAERHADAEVLGIDLSEVALADCPDRVRARMLESGAVELAPVHAEAAGRLGGYIQDVKETWRVWLGFGTGVEVRACIAWGWQTGRTRRSLPPLRE